jgi:hypothetical protein
VAGEIGDENREPFGERGNNTIPRRAAAGHAVHQHDQRAAPLEAIRDLATVNHNLLAHSPPEESVTRTVVPANGFDRSQDTR